MTPTSRWAFATLLFTAGAYAADPGAIRVNRLPLGGEAAATVRVTETKQDVAQLATALRAQLAGANAQTLAPAAREPKQAAPALGPRLGHDVAIEYRSNGTPLQIKGEALQRPVVQQKTASIQRDDVGTAREFLRANASLLRLKNPDRELVVASHATDDLGRAHVRFEQQFDGLPVWPAEVIVHLDRLGNVDLMDGAFVPTPRRIPTRPIVSVTGAVAKARALFPNALSTNGNGSGTINLGTLFGSGNITLETQPSADVPQLIVYAPGNRRPRLAWKTQVNESLAKRWTVVVDATSGAVLTRFNNVETANVTGSGRDLGGTTRSLNVWSQNGAFFLLDSTKQMFDPTSTPPSPQQTRGGIFVADATNLPATNNPTSFPPLSVVQSTSASNWPVADTVSAAFWMSQTYDYYLQRHGRSSIDGNGGTMTGIVRLGRGYENAFWDNEQQFMVFGDADLYAGSLDVIAHEMTHGVTDHSARLVYQDESGALNEAMSDIFGEMTEARTFGANDWVIGSQLHTPIRNMKNPAVFGDPTKMSEFLHTSSDNGGVHTNSGIINRAYYLLAEGLPGAIGRADAERIFYRALTQHLTKDAHFLDARIAAIQSADELFGAASNQSKKVAEAFDAVEIFGASPTPEPPPIPAVNAADATLFVYRDAQNDSWFLGRREIVSDTPNGATLSHFDVSRTRPSVTADGTIAAFVDSVHDVCLIATSGSGEEQCLDLPSKGIEVSSVGMSPDGSRFGFVLLGSDGDPENDIIVVDLGTNTNRTYTVGTPTYDGGAIGTVDYADSMTFTADNHFLVYDAFNELTANGSAWGAWSIYALELSTGTTYNVVPPTEGLEFGFPFLGRTSSDLLTFEAYDDTTGKSSIVAANLDTGDLNVVATETGVEAVPSFNGNDRSIVYAIPGSNSSGTSLAIVNLQSDHITAAGQPALWLGNGAYPSIYRRGTYSGPTTQPGTLAFSSTTYNGNEGAVVTIKVLRNGGIKGAVSVHYATAGGTATAGSDYTGTSGTLTWADGDGDPKSFAVRLSADSLTEGNETIGLTLTSPTGGATIGTASALVTIANGAAPTRPKRRRSAPH